MRVYLVMTCSSPVSSLSQLQDQETDGLIAFSLSFIRVFVFASSHVTFLELWSFPLQLFLLVWWLFFVWCVAIGWDWLLTVGSDFYWRLHRSVVRTCFGIWGRQFWYGSCLFLVCSFFSYDFERCIGYCFMFDHACFCFDGTWCQYKSSSKGQRRWLQLPSFMIPFFFLQQSFK